MIEKRAFFLLIVALALVAIGCNPKTYDLDPCVCFEPSPTLIRSLPKAFPPLSPEERSTDWGKELVIGEHFSSSFDLYRAITSFQRAQILLPSENTARGHQIAFDTLFCYFLGHKYPEVIEAFEQSDLGNVNPQFPTYRELLIILYVSYQKLGNSPREKVILEIIEQYDPSLAGDLRTGNAFLTGDLCTLSTSSPFIQEQIRKYECQSLSPRKAQILNALLPGAGYWYAGQKTTALTSFLLNAVFITATYELFKNGYVAAGVITGSLEFGWYFGGINGAGLAAKNWNDKLYNAYAKDTMLDLRLFPVLQFRRAF